MSRSSTILRNVASNWVGFATNAGITLLLTPFVVHELGTARYGVWILTSSVLGYYGFLDIGFRAGVSQYLTRYMALKDFAKASECLSSAVAVLSSLAGLILVLSVAGAGVTPYWFKLPPDLASEAFWCIFIVGATTALNFAFTPFMAVFGAMQRFDLTNLIGFGTRLLSAVSVYAALKLGYGLVGVSLATSLTNIIDYLIRWRVARRLAPELQLSRSLVRVGSMREVGTFGLWSFFISLNAYVYQYLPSLLIGAFLPIAAVGYYALATGLIRQLSALMSPISQVLYPAATQLHSLRDEDGLERLYHDGSRLMMLVSFPAILIAGIWAHDFYAVWLGERALSPMFPPVALLFQVILLRLIPSAFSSIAAQVLSGADRIRALAITLALGSLVNVVLTIVLLPGYGLLGVAVATVASSVLVEVVVLPVMMSRALNLGFWAFLKHSAARPFVVAFIQLGMMLAIRSGGPARDWTHLLIHGVAAGVSSLVVIVLVGINRAERSRFLVAPFRPLLRRTTALVSQRS